MNPAWLTIPLLLLVPACEARPVSAPAASNGEQTSGAPRPVAPAAAPTAAQDVRLAIGEYRVAAADGEDINLPHAITLSVTQDEIRLSSQCFAPRWSWRYDGGGLVTQRIAEAQCERTRYPAEIAAEAVFAQPDEIVRTSANGLLVTGGGHNLLLFSQ